MCSNGIGGGGSGKWIVFSEGRVSHGEGGGASGGGIRSVDAPSNVSVAITVTAMAGLALVATVIYYRR